MIPAEELNNNIREFWPKNGPSPSEVEKYVKKYSKEKIVIKCGGRVLLDQILLNSLIEDVVLLKKLGLTPILIHGGGLGIKKKLEEQNIKSKFIMGLRVTDEKMIKIVESVMSEFNEKIVNILYSILIVIIISAIFYGIEGVSYGDYTLGFWGDVEQFGGILNVIGNLLYFSVVVFSTVGFGEILPIGPVGKSIMMVEGIAGGLILSIFMIAVYRQLMDR